MEISGSSTPFGLTAQSGNDAASLLVFKKALDIQAQSALALIESVSKSAGSGASNLPAHLGQNINTTA